MMPISNGKRFAGDDETFVRLIQVAGEDAEIKKQILGFLSLDNFNRKSALNTFIHEMRLKGAPREFVSAIACFLDDGVAERALAILTKDREKGSG